jgi:hypothetical protein
MEANMASNRRVYAVVAWRRDALSIKDYIKVFSSYRKASKYCGDLASRNKDNNRWYDVEIWDVF